MFPSGNPLSGPGQSMFDNSSKANILRCTRPYSLNRHLNDGAVLPDGSEKQDAI